VGVFSARKSARGRKRRRTGSRGEEAPPAEKEQYNFTDPESRIRKSSSEGFVQACNVPLAVEPMVKAIEGQSGQRPDGMLADNGYCSEKNLEYLESAKKPEQKIEAYVATGRQKHGERRVCPRGPLPQGTTRVERRKRKLPTKAGSAICAARKAIVKPVFGQIKQVRGLAKVPAEWALLCATHNILKVYRLCYG